MRPPCCVWSASLFQASQTGEVGTEMHRITKDTPGCKLQAAGKQSLQTQEGWGRPTLLVSRDLSWLTGDRAVQWLWESLSREFLWESATKG